MRPLPRLHAVTDAGILAAPDFGIRAAAIAAAGSAVALHARDRAASGAALTRAAQRLLALARPPEAAVFVNARADIAAAVGAHGVQLGSADLSAADARTVFPRGWVGRSVHSTAEAVSALSEGVDYLMVGNVYQTPTHPDRPGIGVGLIREVAALGRPVIAIGGIDSARVAEVHDAGAYGVASIRAVWVASDPAAAALALLAPWMGDA